MPSISPSETALATVVTSGPLDLAIMGWIHAKWNLSQSVRTRDTYRETIDAFRAVLRFKGLDLDSDPRAITLIAQEFASFSSAGKQLSGGSMNLRLAIISSFYEYAIRNDILFYNPIKKIERAKTQRYRNALPLRSGDITERFGKIDRTTRQGCRDFALLAVLLQTGRRLSEVAHMQWKDITLQGEKCVVVFPRCKGNETMVDELPKPVTSALVTWLIRYYGDLAKIVPDAPVWIALSRPYYNKPFTPLGIHGIAGVCEHYLGTSRVHTTRHTFTRTMLEAGADPTEIQRRLGHKSLQTTSIYLSELTSSENKYADKIAALYGLE